MKNKGLHFQIKEGSIKDAFFVSNQVPELTNPHQREVYEARMSGKKHLILIAYHEDKMVGFKVGYDKFEDGENFYTWMGGVLPSFRNGGIAYALAKRQETWAKTNGFEAIILKTRNRHQGMLIFAIKNGFKITEVTSKNSIDENRILLKKML